MSSSSIFLILLWASGAQTERASVAHLSPGGPGLLTLLPCVSDWPSRPLPDGQLLTVLPIPAVTAAQAAE